VTGDFILLGHTHFPMIRRIGAQTVINPRSVVSRATATHARATPSSTTACPSFAARRPTWSGRSVIFARYPSLPRSPTRSSAS
jgi:hypothetical protein